MENIYKTYKEYPTKVLKKKVLKGFTEYILRTLQVVSIENIYKTYKGIS
jgi:hypothetical protein